MFVKCLILDLYCIFVDTFQSLLNWDKSVRHCTWRRVRSWSLALSGRHKWDSVRCEVRAKAARKVQHRVWSTVLDNRPPTLLRYADARRTQYCVWLAKRSCALYWLTNCTSTDNNSERRRFRKPGSRSVIFSLAFAGGIAKWTPYLHHVFARLWCNVTNCTSFLMH